MAFTDQFTLAGDAAFRGRVRMAMNEVALAVVGETPTSSARRDEKRHDLGVAILRNSGGALLDSFAYACAGFGTLTGVSSDNDIEFVVSSVFSDIAGVRGAE